MGLVVSPTVVALNSQGGSPKHALTPGQLIDALVLELIDATTVRLAVADSVIELKTDLALAPGAHVRLAARGHGDDVRWVIAGGGGAPGVPRTGQDAGRSAGHAPAHPASPATAVTIGKAALAAEATSTTSQARAEQMQPPQRQRPAETSPAVQFANATRSAAARQSGLAPLFADLKVVTASPPIPPAVRQLAALLLATPVPLDRGSGDVLRKAVARSGLFLEARLAGAGSAGHVAPAIPTGDLKAVLLSLKNALQGWIDAMPPSLPAASKGDVAAAPLVAGDIKPPPPYRGAPTSGQQPASSKLVEGMPLPDVARTLLEHTDGALARQVLAQVASLPDAPGIVPSQVSSAERADRHWNLEIPFAMPQGTAIAHFEIVRDGRRTSHEQKLAVPWRVNFSLDVEPVGLVHAQIALVGKRATVNIWAERSETATALRAGVSDLTGALRAATLDAGDVVVRDGAPPRPLKANPGRFLDRAT